MAHLSIRLLGPFSVHLNDTPVSAFRSDKVRALLAYLVTESDRAFRRETLAGLLWPDVPEASARNSLRTALVNLRTAIGDRAADPPFLHISRTSLQFNVDSDAWCDVTAFRRLVTPLSSPLYWEETIQSLDEAVGLYRAGFLEGLGLADSVAFEDWALIKREQFQRQALEALHHLAAFHEQHAEYGNALPFAWRQVELDPWREEAQRQVMRVLALGGQKSAALAQYETCRQVLAEELGIEPGAETKRLYEHIRDGMVAPSSNSETSQLEQPTELARAPSSRKAQADDQMLRGQSLQEQGDFASARDCFEHAAELYHALGDREQEASVLRQLGRICFRQGDQAAAQPYLEQALRYYHETGMRWEEATTLVLLGALFRETGEYTRSVVYAYSALDIYRKLGRQRGQNYPLTHVDDICRYLETPASMYSCVQPRLESHRMPHNPNLGGARQKTARPGERSIPLAIARSLLTIGSALGARGTYEGAARCLEDCSAVCQRAGLKNELGVALALRGYANRRRSLVCREFLCRAFQVGLALRSIEPILYSLPGLVYLLAKQGETVLAVELQALALREYPTTPNTRWLGYITEPGSRLQPMASTLPRQVVAQARKRGRARDLWATVEDLYAVWCE